MAIVFAVSHRDLYAALRLPAAGLQPRYDFWSMAHEARADFCMLLGSLYLLIEGGGRWSIDAALVGQRRR
jgi:uncharacterized membrane protein YphA (DoxX/SURF4 family)